MPSSIVKRNFLRSMEEARTEERHKGLPQRGSWGFAIKKMYDEGGRGVKFSRDVRP